MQWLAAHPFWATLALTVFIEALTAAGRFLGGFQACRDTAFVAAITGGIRIHHCYVGAALLALAAALAPSPGRRALLCVGSALVLSDLAHHFFVLWPATGHPEFHLVYPARGPE